MLRLPQRIGRGGNRENDVSKVRYWVYYGNHTSREGCYNMREVSAFIAHCLRNGTPVTGVTKA